MSTRSEAESTSDANPTTQLGILFSFKGRIPVSVLWLRGYLPLLGLALVVSFVDAAIYHEGGPLDEVMGVLSLWPIVALSVKRCHDRDRSGWFCLVYLVPVVNLWVMVDLWALPGTARPNRFGPDPLYCGTPAEIAAREDALANMRDPDASQVDEYVAALQHSDPKVREAAVEALGKLGGSAVRAEPALVGAKRDSNMAVRARAGWALEQVRRGDA